jgi:hypothetical protein
LTRPLVECDERLGTLPGGPIEKTAPQMASMVESLKEHMTSEELLKLMEEEVIEVCPLAVMRGRTFANAFVVADESENATRRQLRMLLTRVGHNCKLVVNGDLRQSDLPGECQFPSVIADLTRAPVRADIALVKMRREDSFRPEIVQFVDERLDGPAARPAEECIPCPGCDADVWYDQGVDAEQRLVLCPHCFSHVELRDARDRFDPGCVSPRKEELPRVHNGRKTPAGSVLSVDEPR